MNSLDWHSYSYQFDFIWQTFFFGTGPRPPDCFSESLDQPFWTVSWSNNNIQKNSRAFEKSGHHKSSTWCPMSLTHRYAVWPVECWLLNTDCWHTQVSADTPKSLPPLVCLLRLRSNRICHKHNAVVAVVHRCPCRVRCLRCDCDPSLSWCLLSL